MAIPSCQGRIWGYQRGLSSVILYCGKEDRVFARPVASPILPGFTSIATLQIMLKISLANMCTFASCPDNLRISLFMKHVCCTVGSKFWGCIGYERTRISSSPDVKERQVVVFRVKA